MLAAFKGYTKLSSLLSLPYKAGGRSPEGVDCYGLSMAAAQILGYDLPEIDYERLSELRPLFPFRIVAKPHRGCFAEIRATKDKPPHCGIYISSREVIHASENHGVRVDRADWLGVEAFYEITKRIDDN